MSREARVAGRRTRKPADPSAPRCRRKVHAAARRTYDRSRPGAVYALGSVESVKRKGLSNVSVLTGFLNVLYLTPRAPVPTLIESPTPRSSCGIDRLRLFDDVPNPTNPRRPVAGLFLEVVFTDAHGIPRFKSTCASRLAQSQIDRIAPGGTEKRVVEKVELIALRFAANCCSSASGAPSGACRYLEDSGPRLFEKRVARTEPVRDPVLSIFTRNGSAVEEQR